MNPLMTYSDFINLVNVFKTLPSSKEVSGYSLVTYKDISYLYNEQKMIIQMGYIVPGIKKNDSIHESYQGFIYLSDGSTFVPHNLEGPSFYIFDSYEPGKYRIQRYGFDIDSVRIGHDYYAMETADSVFYQHPKVIEYNKNKMSLKKENIQQEEDFWKDLNK